ncbi:HAD family phosphatase [Catenovulum sp. 2E275]|uniref:HAD family hydrolase n=1 Tax=Catenovulum sp. 2E275 TaxID=2980497 RepID=UPI0021D04E71|nr:HAD family phosphatase [Catenovulum sp. 2E275]MCU4674112.1 HAD family phosphatase [Catenovulum sp. 2E275]
MTNQPEIKAILFDKDGTIFDSEAAYRDAWVTSAQHFNLEMTPQMYDPFVGIRAAESYKLARELFGNEFPLEEFAVKTRELIDYHKMRGLPIKKGFDRFFQQARQLNIPMGLVTSAVYDAAVLTFCQTDYLAHFDIIVAGDMVKHAKPSPECYLMASEKLGVEPQHILVFEDSNAGVEAATSAGCQTVAIPDYLPVHEALLAKASYVLESFDQAHSIIANINKAK